MEPPPRRRPEREILQRFQASWNQSGQPRTLLPILRREDRFRYSREGQASWQGAGCNPSTGSALLVAIEGTRRPCWSENDGAVRRELKRTGRQSLQRPDRKTRRANETPGPISELDDRKTKLWSNLSSFRARLD